MTYAARWARSWSVLAAVEVGFASLQWSPFVVLLAVLVSWACVAAGFLLRQTPGAPAADAARRRARRTGQRSFRVACCVVALSALTAAAPVLALLAALLAVLTSPIVVGRRPPRAFLRESPGEGHTSTAEPAQRTGPPGWSGTGNGTLERLDDHELCRLWRGTFWELTSQPSVQACLCVVALRQSCLDELERRNPSAVLAWLASGARASGGPERFLAGRANPAAPADPESWQ